MAAKFFTGLPLDGPDPECVLGHGTDALDARSGAATPRPSPDHSSRPRRRWPSPLHPRRTGPTAGATRARWPGPAPPSGRSDRAPRDRSGHRRVAARPVPCGLRPPRDEPRRRAGDRPPSRRLLRGPGRRRRRGAGHRARLRRTRPTGPTSGRRWPRSCGPGWRAVADACRPHGTVVLAGLGHAGGQGSSAYSQSVLWAPSPVADAASRELPMAMGPTELAAIVDGFAASARAAVGRRTRRSRGRRRGRVAAPPVPLGDHQPARRRLRRGPAPADPRGPGRRPRAAVGPDVVVALRLSCDELAPWAGVTPDHAADQVDALADRIDLLTVVRGGPVLGHRLPSRRPHRRRVQRRAVRRHAPGGRRARPGGTPGQCRRRRQRPPRRWPTGRPTWWR